MDSKTFRNESVFLYNLLEEHKCLCLYRKNPKIYLEFSKTYFDESHVSGEKENCQLLSISMLRLLAETYVAEINKHQRICKDMQTFFKILCEEDMFYCLVDRYLTTNDQHLLWSFAKTISAIFYGSQQCITKEWINFIVKNLMLQSSDDKCFRLIELLSFLVGSGLKASRYKNDDNKCQNIISYTLPLPKDHYICICSELIPYWNQMVEIYSNSSSTEDKKEIAFLNLWKQIINGSLQDDLSAIYFNKKYILNIFLHGNLNKPKVVSLYVEIIIKILCSNLKCRPWEGVDFVSIEKSVTTALGGGLLKSVPTDYPEFCKVIKKTSSSGSLNVMNDENERNFGVVGKNVIFILMNLLAEFQNMQLLCESYQKIIAFISQKNMLSPLWLVNIFLDDDDLLFGAMLASLRIYKNLQNNNNIRPEQFAVKLFLLHDINPHALFLQFLQFIGYDHNELISFLVSDETCCLLYLTEYLKLLLIEKDKFVKTYIMLVSDKEFNFASNTKGKKYQSGVELNKSHDEQIQKNSCNNNGCSDEILMKVNLAINTEMNNEKDEIFKNNCLLVTYSSSSEDESCDEKENDVENLLKTVLVLKNLKDGIQKLVDINEFPYNISPLLFLLKSCENLFR